MPLVDGPSDDAMGKTKQKGFHSPSPFGTLKEFGTQLSKAFGLGDSHRRHHLSHPAVDEELFASFEPQLTETGRHRPRRRHKPKTWDPWISYGTGCWQPGPSTPRTMSSRQNATSSGSAADDKDGRGPFMEIHEWWLEEINLVIRFDEEKMELDFLPEDSPLKGKEVAAWRLKVPRMESEQQQLDYPCPTLRPPEKSFQGWATRPLEGITRPPVHHKEEINSRPTEIRLQDGKSNMILRIEPRLKLRR